jgi:fibronectin type 3 domain-containing protein
MRRILLVVSSILALGGCVDLTKPEKVAECDHKGQCTNGSLDGGGDVTVKRDTLGPDKATLPDGTEPALDDSGVADDTPAVGPELDGGDLADVPTPDSPITPSVDGAVVDAPAVNYDVPPSKLDVRTNDVKDAYQPVDVGPGACLGSNGQPLPAGTVCRKAAGLCDVAESCDGVSSDCPADKLAAAGKECRAAAGDCDIAETCSGSSVDCPTDGFKSAGTVCRAAAGPCDYAETCSGASATCPVDSLKPSTYVCNASTGNCDPAENCTGLNVTCPQDVVYTAPTGVITVTAQAGSLSATISWTALAGATEYRLDRATVSGGPYTTIASNLLASQSPYLDSGLDNTKLYYYVVTGFNTISTCKSASSTEVSVQPTGSCTKPAAPVVTATAGNGQVTLSWAAVTDATNGYDIARSETSTTGYSSIARVTTGTSYIDPNVQFGKTYYYQVTTLGTCNSDPSIEVSASPLCSPAAPAPTGLVANAPNTGGVVGLTWTAVTGATSSTKYEILRKSHAAPDYAQIDEVTSPTTTYSDTTVSNGSAYDYVVTFNNGTCTSAYSNLATVTPACVMDKPVLTTTPGNNKVDLSWTAPANGSLSGFKVYRKDTGSYAVLTTLTGASNTTYSDTTAANGTTYTYYVTAVGNCNADSDPKTAAPVCTPLAAPVNLKATAGDTQATLSWTAVQGADHYTVKRGSVTGGPYTPLTPASPITTNSYTDTGLLDGTPYYYVVTASNGTCDSANSVEATVTPQTCPSQGPPGTPTLAITSSTQVNVQWTAANPAPYGGYNIMRSTSATGNFVSVGPASASPYTDTSSDLTVGTTYYYAVQAIGSACSSTSPASSIAFACSKPAKPTASITANSDGTIKVSWNTVDGATAYTVSRGTTDGGPYTAIAAATNITATSYTDTALTNTTNYYYVVTASNAKQQCVSTQSTQVSARSCIIPAVPTGVSATRTGNNRVTVGWTNSTGALSYYVQRSDSTSFRTTSGSPYIDTAAANATAYSYVVSAASDAGGLCSSGNSTSTASVLACTVMGAGVTSYGLNPQSKNAYCFVTCYDIQGVESSNEDGRTMTINGSTVSCPVNGNCTPPTLALPAKNGGYVFQLSACPSSGTCYAWPQNTWWGTSNSCP